MIQVFFTDFCELFKIDDSVSFYFRKVGEFHYYIGLFNGPVGRYLIVQLWLST